MPKTLTLHFDGPRHEVGIRLAGFSFKEITFDHNFIRSDSGYYALEVPSFKIEGRTAMVKYDYLIENLANVYDDLPFDKVKVVGRYPKTGEEIYNDILKTVNE